MEHLGLGDAENAATNDGAGARGGVSRRTIMKGAAWTVPALMVTTAAPAWALSFTCAIGSHTTIGRGKLVSGAVFNLNLDTLASVNGVRANAPLPRTSEIGFDSDATTADPDEFANTLSITALSALKIDATGATSGTVTPILSDLLPATVGAHGQYSYAASQGASKGAAGVIVNNGDTALTPNAAYPDFGTLSLKTLLTPLLGGNASTAFTGNITDLNLQIGAVAGRANWNVCVKPATLVRDYLVNHLRLVITSPLLATLTNLIVTTLNTALAVPIGLGRVTITPAIITNGSNGANPPAAANPALPIPAGTSQPIQANLGSTTTANGIAPGTIMLDLATLMGSAAANPFGGSAQPFLNGAPANSILFVDTSFSVPGTAVSNFIGAIPSTPAGTDGRGLQGALWSRLLDAIYLNVGSFSGTLRVALGAGLTGVAKTLVDTVVAALNSLFSVTLATIMTATLPAVFSTVFGWLSTTINIKLNVQNVPGDNTPATPAAHPGPAAWSFAPRHDVAAIGVNAVSGNALALYIARGSVGPNT